MTETVRVACTIPNGIELRLYREGHDDGTGTKPRVPDGDPVFIPGPNSTPTGAHATGTLQPVVTEINAHCMRGWLEQNEKNPFVVRGSIMIEKVGPVSLASDDKKGEPLGTAQVEPAKVGEPESGNVSQETQNPEAGTAEGTGEAKANPT